MKGLLLTVCGALLLGGSVAAQSPRYEIGGLVLSNDALSTADMFSLSQTQFNFGTARSMGMGGAFTSLGADLSSMSINPAGLGMYRRGEVALTPMMSFSDSSTPGALSPTNALPYRDNSKSRFTIGNFGAVFNVYEGQGNLLSLNFGVGYNRIADFNYNTSFEFAGTNRTSSIADALSVMLEAGGATASQDVITLDGYSGWDINAFFWPGVAAYKTYMVDQNASGVWYPPEIGDNATVDGGASMRSTGSVGEFDISMGGNINNKLYFGFTLGIQNIHQKKRVYYGERYTYNGGNGYNTGDPAVDAEGNELTGVMQSMGMSQTAEVQGAGVNFKMGLTYRPIDGLRLGVAFHTPTYYSLDRRYFISMSTASIGPTNADQGDYRPHEYTADASPEQALEDTGDYGWSFVSPTRLLFGASYTLGNVAIFSVDYQRDWYNGIRVKNKPPTYIQDIWDYKQDFKYYFKGSNTVRAGVEVRPLPTIALRAGFGYTGSMLRDEKTILSSPVIYQTTYYTAGVGFQLGRATYLDLAYCYAKNKMTPYMLFYGNKYDDAAGQTEIYQSEVYKTDITRHNIALTFGFRF